MKNFDVRVKTNTSYDTLRISAETISDAKEKASSVGRVLSAKASKGQIISRGLKARDRIFLLKRIASLTKSRNSLANTLEVIAETFPGKIADVSKSLNAKMQDGANIIDALKTMPEHFPSSTVSLIKSEIHANGISTAFKNAAAFEDEMLKIGKDAQEGFAGAMVQLVVGSITILGTVYWMAPWMLDSPLFSMSEQTDVVTLMFLLGDIHGAIIAFLLGIFTVILLMTQVFKPLVPEFSDRITVKIPIFRDIVLSKKYYIVFYGLSLLVKAGIGIKESLEIAYGSAPKGAIKNDIKAAILAIEEGRVWADDMVNLSKTDRACMRTAQSKEDIAESFMDIADSHKDIFIYRIKQTIPVLYLLGVYMSVMGMVLMMGLTIIPTFQLSGSLL